VVLYQLVKQQGRLLLRLDELETRLGPGGQAAAQHGSAELAVGMPMRPFQLTDLNGKELALEAFKGTKVLLIHWSPQCGFCDLIASDLAGLEPDLEKRDVRTLFLSHGDAESNRKMAEEHGLTSPILLVTNEQALEVFGHMGTPVAYLVDELGRVARPVAIGSDAVPALVRKAAGNRGKKQPGALPGERPLSESRIERNGLKAGTVAPGFTLPDVHGRPVSLEQYRGRQVLLVFTNPHCGPCDALAPHLVELHRRYGHNGLALIMVGRGETDENRRKVDQYGFQFPVVVQEGWKLSKEYGIFGAPVAFLIDEDGRIAKDVARGVDEIVALAEKQE
jgi:peroxiredoxin